MELLHVGVRTADLLGRDPVVVGHRDTALTRALRMGEEVVVADSDGEYHAATVIAVEGDDEPAYHLRIGARLPLELVAQRLASDYEEPEDVGIHEVVDLLGDLRRLLRAPPPEEADDDRDDGDEVSGPEEPGPR